MAKLRPSKRQKEDAPFNKKNDKHTRKQQQQQARHTQRQILAFPFPFLPLLLLSVEHNNLTNKRQWKEKLNIYSVVSPPVF